MQHDLLPSQALTPVAQEEHSIISTQVCPMRYEVSSPSAQSQRKLLGRRIGEVGVIHYESRGLERARRTLDHVRAETADYFLLCVPLRARLRFALAGLENDVELGDGTALLLSARRPFDAYIHGATEDWHSSLQARIPAPLLRSRLPAADQLCGRAFDVQSASGALMRTLLAASLRQADALTERQAARHGNVMLDVIANALLSADEDDAPLPSSAHWNSQQVFERAISHIESQLSCPELDASSIAEHCKVSLRYLHKIFAQRSLTVAGTVREARLERCREALQSTRMATRSVIEIAGMWGFCDPSHFGRVYRKRFGVSPSQERPRPAANPAR